MTNYVYSNMDPDDLSMGASTTITCTPPRKYTKRELQEDVIYWAGEIADKKWYQSKSNGIYELRKYLKLYNQK